MKVKYYTHDDKGFLQEVEEEWDFSEFEKNITIKEETNNLGLQFCDEIKRIFETGLNSFKNNSPGGLFYYFNLRNDSFKEVLDFFEKQKEYGFVAVLETFKKMWSEFYEKEMNEIIEEVEKILEKHSKFLNTNSILANLENSLKEEFFDNFDKLYAKNFFLVWEKIIEKYKIV